MTSEDKTEIAAMIAAALKPVPILGPDGLPVLPPPPRTPFPWGAAWKKIEPFVTPILVAASAAAVLWINSLNHKDTTEKVQAVHETAEKGLVQAEKNGKQVNRIVGAAVTG